MSRLPLLLAACLVLPHGGCLGPTQRMPSSAVVDAQPALSSATRAWEVVEAGKVIGIVVEFSELGGDRIFYSVRNGEQQELGMIDSHGRAWRYRAHEPEPDWLVTGTVLDGVRAILGTGEQAGIYEVQLATLVREAR